MRGTVTRLEIPGQDVSRDTCLARKVKRCAGRWLEDQIDSTDVRHSLAVLEACPV